MRNSNYTQPHQTSREFYNQVLKNKPKNLNLSKNNTDKVDLYLDKFLLKSYQVLSPIFNDEQQNTNYQKETIHNNTDKEFDEKIERYSPSWLKLIFKLLLHIYHLFFPKSIQAFIKKLNLFHFKKQSNQYQNKFRKHTQIFQKKASP